MHKIIYTKKSKRDLIGIQNYISNDNILYAIKTVNSIKSTIKMLKIFPKMGTIIEDETRFLIEKNYKYKIVYEIEEDNIYILNIYKYKNIWI